MSHHFDSPRVVWAEMAAPSLATIEDAMARDLRDYVAAYRRVAPDAVATSTEVAGGVAAFTGLDSPLTTLKGAGPNLSRRDLRAIESFFRDHGAAAATIEMAPWITVETERALAESGYRVTGHEDVMVSGSLRAAPALAVDVVALEEWPAVMHRCYELEPGSPEADLVAASAQIPGCRLYGVRDATDWIACAGTVPYDSIVIFGNDGTRPEARGRGAQRALIDRAPRSASEPRRRGGGSRAGQRLRAQLPPLRLRHRLHPHALRQGSGLTAVRGRLQPRPRPTASRPPQSPVFARVPSDVLNRHKHGNVCRSAVTPSVNCHVSAQRPCDHRGARRRGRRRSWGGGRAA